MHFYITKRDGSRLRVTISDEDSALAQLRWHMAGGRGSVGKYASRRANGVTLYLHREVAFRAGLVDVVIGEGRSVPSVDHLNGNKLDNRRENLALRTRQEQMNNPNDGLRRNNTSGYRGVSFLTKQRLWMAYVQVDHKSRSLGTFTTKEEAIAARAAWDAEHMR